MEAHMKTLTLLEHTHAISVQPLHHILTDIHNFDNPMKTHEPLCETCETSSKPMHCPYTVDQNIQKFTETQARL